MSSRRTSSSSADPDSSLLRHKGSKRCCSPRRNAGVGNTPDLVFGDRKSTRLNSSHGYISYAVFCLKKKTKHGEWAPVHASLPPLLRAVRRPGLPEPCDLLSYVAVPYPNIAQRNPSEAPSTPLERSL